MHEQKKIREAEFFYAHLLKTEKNTQDERDKFEWFLSAFVSAARSVSQYARQEAVGKPGGRQWYEHSMTQSRVLRFFKKKRDINIHVEPVTAVKEIGIQIDASMNFWMDASAPLPATPTLPTAFMVSEKYKFIDWVGSEGVLKLCEEYLHDLHAFVHDGQQKGLLTL